MFLRAFGFGHRHHDVRIICLALGQREIHELDAVPLGDDAARKKGVTLVIVGVQIAVIRVSDDGDRIVESVLDALDSVAEVATYRWAWCETRNFPGPGSPSRCHSAVELGGERSPACRLPVENIALAPASRAALITP